MYLFVLLPPKNVGSFLVPMNGFAAFLVLKIELRPPTRKRRWSLGEKKQLQGP